ncbi:hypothetical protein [Sulfurovum sp.]|jgi:hypothetical protein|uniref:hypothetical protein n=1 Tax=Sulfurovum sp. TaxID=1969726 RepID=UPI003561A92E
MTIADIEFEMNINDVMEKDISEIIEICNKSGFNLESIDDELQNRGYSKIFTVNYDDMSDDVYDDEWED